MQLPLGPLQLKLTAESVRGRELMALHKIWLRRV